MTICSDDEEPPKLRGRQAGAKSYNQQTLYKLIVEYKPRNMVLWATLQLIIDDEAASSRNASKQKTKLR